MSDRSNLRLIVLGVLVFSLLCTLGARLVYLQLVAGESFKAQAVDNSTRDLVTPAVRGLILDQDGRPLVANRVSLVVSVDRAALRKQDDDGAAVLQRLADALGTTLADIQGRLLNCGTEGAPPLPLCWNGSPYEAVPVAKDVPDRLALQILERSTDFPGVTAQLRAVREYPTPYGSNAAHLLGYIGPVTAEQLEAQGDSTEIARLRATDLVGRSGLEAQYDTELRGIPGVTTVNVDQGGRVVGSAEKSPPQAGNYVVTNIDAPLQAVVERELRAAIDRVRAQGGAGESGAAVVVDTTNGHVLAMASYPTYDPTIWVGGISTTDFQQLMDSKGLSSNAWQGALPPGSTYKVFTTAAAIDQGFSETKDYKCPAEYRIGPQVFRNSDSVGYGRISLARALEVSCNTVFYGLGDEIWKSFGGYDTPVDSIDPIAQAAEAFGLGAESGIDLPAERAGRVHSPLSKRLNWEQNKDTWCADASSGYPEVRLTDPKKADYFTALAVENCQDGFRWRQGDAVNASIGQGDTATTPLQLAMAYAAIANGGTLWQPQIARGILSATGEVVKEFAPVSRGQVDVSQGAITFLQNSLPGVPVNGTAAPAFKGFPLAQIPVAAKTGSAQISGKDQTASWMAAYAPANAPRYAVVMMVTQSATASGTSAPGVRNIIESLFGVSGRTVDPAKSVFPDGQPAVGMPRLSADGTPATPEDGEVPTSLGGVIPTMVRRD